MKKWLQEIGILEKLETKTFNNQPIPASQGYYLATDVGAFLEEARKHYCDICKKWFGDVRGAKAHIRIKHGK